MYRPTPGCTATRTVTTLAAIRQASRGTLEFVLDQDSGQVTVTRRDAANRALIRRIRPEQGLRLLGRTAPRGSTIRF